VQWLDFAHLFDAIMVRIRPMVTGICQISQSRENRSQLLIWRVS
jgi:hypothetical protein